MENEIANTRDWIIPTEVFEVHEPQSPVVATKRVVRSVVGCNQDLNITRQIGVKIDIEIGINLAGNALEPIQGRPQRTIEKFGKIPDTVAHAGKAIEPCARLSKDSLSRDACLGSRSDLALRLSVGETGELNLEVGKLFNFGVNQIVYAAAFDPREQTNALYRVAGNQTRGRQRSHTLEKFERAFFGSLPISIVRTWIFLECKIAIGSSYSEDSAIAPLTNLFDRMYGSWRKSHCRITNALGNVRILRGGYHSNLLPIRLHPGSYREIGSSDKLRASAGATRRRGD